jgi:hypothetical protein
LTTKPNHIAAKAGLFAGSGRDYEISKISASVWLREPDSNRHYGGRIDDSLQALDFPALRDRFAAALSAE